MTNELRQNRRLIPMGVLLLCLVLLALGIFVRWVNLDGKIYRGDETFTSLRISGYTQREFRQQIYDGHEIGIKDIHKYQRTNSEKGIVDTIKGLATEEPQLTPLYFVMVRLWAGWFGNSVAVTRSLSVLLSLFAFPCVYWLCLELFNSAVVAWVAIALMAISPFHLLYAQEARPYYLWIVTILLSSAALLYARRRSDILSWGMYGATVALGLYSHFLFVLVSLGHGIYILLLANFRLTRTFIAYLSASVAGFVAFTPWMWILVNNSSKMPSWFSQKVDLLFLAKAWVGDLSRVFLDLGGREGQILSLIPLILILFILIGYSVYFLYCQTAKQVWLFVLTLIGVTGLTLILSDLLLGGHRSSVGRYLIPSYLGIQLAVAYLLATKITSIYPHNWHRKLWQLLTVGVFSLGLLSCGISSQAQEWWNKDPTYHYPQVAAIINQAPRPLIISDSGQPSVIALSYLLKSNVRLQLGSPQIDFKIADGFSDIFLYRPSRTLLNKLKQQHKLKLVHLGGRLWKLEKSWLST
ncbi:MAG: glycosyltransferase family 39 protein [Xenococcaceae cyanobacterium]